jgi:hypothetical protein
VRSADHDHAREFVGLFGERVSKDLDCRKENVAYLLDGCDVHGGGEGVV